MSLSSKLRNALNKQARLGESCAVGEFHPVDGRQGEWAKVTVRIYRRGLLPPMTFTLENERELSRAYCENSPTGLEGVAGVVWGALRADSRHPDHAQSQQTLTRELAERLEMPPEEIAKEVLQAHSEHQIAEKLTKTLEIGDKKTGSLPNTGKDFIVPQSSPPPTEAP